MTELSRLRAEAKGGRDPTCADETLALLKRYTAGKEQYLEIGAAEGLTVCALLLENPALHAVAIERDPVRASRAREHFSAFGVSDRVQLYEGDAGAILPMVECVFNVIFLDGPKAQYIKYLPDCKRLLRRGGALFSDDILLYGWVRGEPPKKRRMLVEHIREYLTLLENDPDFDTQIFEYGEGLAVSTKR